MPLPFTASGMHVPVSTHTLHCYYDAFRSFLVMYFDMLRCVKHVLVLITIQIVTGDVLLPSSTSGVRVFIPLRVDIVIR